MSNTPFLPDALELYSCIDAGGEKHTFALHDVGGAVEVCGCVSWTGDAVVLAKLPLVGASGTADAAVCAGVVVMSWRALDCRGQTQRHARCCQKFIGGLNACRKLIRGLVQKENNF